MEFVPERLRGEVARFDITDKSGKVIVEKDKRITAKHIELEQPAPSSSRAGRLPARPRAGQERRRPDTGEVIAKANDEITEACSKSCAKPASGSRPCTRTIWTRVLHLATLRIDETADQTAARVAIYRMMRPGEPPTEDAVEACSSACSTAPSVRPVAVGRMKFNRRVGRDENRKAMTLQRRHPRVIKILVELRNGRAKSTTSTTWATVACVASANWPRTSSAPVCARRAPSRNVWARPRATT
jgi:DNA-directed RNA polymerase subunit beta